MLGFCVFLFSYFHKFRAWSFLVCMVFDLANVCFWDFCTCHVFNLVVVISEIRCFFFICALLTCLGSQMYGL